MILSKLSRIASTALFAFSTYACTPEEDSHSLYIKDSNKERNERLEYVDEFCDSLNDEDFINSYNESKEEKIERLGDIGEFCKELNPGYNNKEGLNFVFVNLGYGPKDFLKGIKKAVGCQNENEGILFNEPFLSYASNLNFYYVDTKGVFLDEDEEGNPIGPFSTLPKSIEKIAGYLTDNCNLSNKTTVAFINLDFKSYTYRAENRKINTNELSFDNLTEALRLAEGYSNDECKYAMNSVCSSENISEDEFANICDAIDLLGNTQDTSLDTYLCPVLTERSLSPGTAYISKFNMDVLIHELGHSVFGFHDEYLRPFNIKIKDRVDYINEIKLNPVNCFVAESKEECKKNAPWASLVEEGEAGCYGGCGYLQNSNGLTFWRSIDKGKMNGSRFPLYGAWNLTRACDLFNLMTGEAKGVCTKYGSYL